MRYLQLVRLSLFGAALSVPCTAILAQTGASILDTAIVRMGGESKLRDVKRVRFEMMTQWQRTAFDGRPYPDQPSYESHSDLRDYELNAWRNTRRFNTGPSAVELPDIVRDSVAIRRSLGGSGGVASPTIAAAGTWTPLNVAYVDEQRQLFSMAPERLLLAARAAKDLRGLRDTTIGGAAYARVTATIGAVHPTILILRSTGFLASSQFRAAEPNDFGLVPWGTMPVEFWYGGWRKEATGLVYPHQWDVRRVGAPYKRMTVLSAVWNLPASPDSFVVSDSLRSAFVATASKPMHDVPLDSARVLDERFIAFSTPGAPLGAVKVGNSWIALETGQAPLSMERAAHWVEQHERGEKISAALVSMPSGNNGGAAWLAAQGAKVFVSPGAAPFVAEILRGNVASSAARGAIHVAGAAAWVHMGADSLWLEPIDLPDAPGAMIAYVPSLEWIYCAGASSPLYLDLVLARARKNNWRVSRIGSARAITAPVSISH